MEKETTRTLSCILYTVLWQVYNFQESIGLASIGQSLLFILIIFSLYKTVYVLSHYRIRGFMRGLTILLFFLSAFGVYHLFFGPTRTINMFPQSLSIPTFYYLKYIYCSIPVVYVYYDFAMKGVLTRKLISGLCIFFLITSLYAYFSFYSKLGDGIARYIDGLTNNMGYKFVPIMTMLLLVKRWRVSLMLICFGLVVASLKRGAIIIGAINLVAMMLIMYKQNYGFKKILVTLGICIILGIVAYGTLYFYLNNIGFQNRIEQTLDGYTSGRGEIAESLWIAFCDEDTLNQIFGNGADATIDYGGNYAHNDWLELLINQGIIGIILYLLFYYKWYKNWHQLKRKADVKISVVFGVTMISFFLMSIFSMAYTAFGTTYAIIIGYCLYNKNWILTNEKK